MYWPAACIEAVPIDKTETSKQALISSLCISLARQSCAPCLRQNCLTLTWQPTRHYIETMHSLSTTRVIVWLWLQCCNMLVRGTSYQDARITFIQVGLGLYMWLGWNDGNSTIHILCTLAFTWHMSYYGCSPFGNAWQFEIALRLMQVHSLVEMSLASKPHRECNFYSQKIHY